MSRLSVVALTAALALGAASTGQAQDRTSADHLYQYRSGDAEILEPLDGKPYWSSLAECSGFQSAYAVHLKTSGHSGESAEDAGVKLLESSIIRLMKDRKLGFDAARALAGRRAGAARASAERLRGEGTGGASRWNVMRSLCEDLAVHYGRAGL